MRGISEIPLLSLMLGDPECAARGDWEPRLQDIQRRQQVGSVVRKNTGSARQSYPLFSALFRQFKGIRYFQRISLFSNLRTFFEN